MKILKAKENFAGNYCHNILRLSDVWPNFFFSPFETKHGYY